MNYIGKYTPQIKFCKQYRLEDGTTKVIVPTKQITNKQTNRQKIPNLP